MDRKPLIGLTSNYSINGEIGTITKLGAPSQKWQLLAEDYISAVEKAGGIPVIIPITDNPEVAVQTLHAIDGIILTGGNDVNPRLYGQAPDPSLGEISVKRDLVETSILKRAVSDCNMPILAICRGCQLMNVVFGGTLYQDVNRSGLTTQPHFLFSYPIDEVSHEISVVEGSKLHSIFKQKKIGVNSFHHQAIDKLGNGLRITAESDDKVIEAVELEGDRFVVGVQWHPEMMINGTTSYLGLFKAFVDECAKNC
jgi:putative glutamine amidotransferase